MILTEYGKIVRLNSNNLDKTHIGDIIWIDYVKEEVVFVLSTRKGDSVAR